MKHFLILLICFSFAMPVFSQVPTNGLVAYYPFDGSTNDESGHYLNGINAGVTFSDDHAGMANKAGNFNGVNSFIEVPHSALFDTIESHNAMTIAAWVNIRDWYQGWNIFNVINKYESDGDGGWELCFAGQPENAISFVVSNGYSASLPLSLTFGTWYHVALTYDHSSGFVKFYINGNLLAMQQSPSPLQHTHGPLYIGFSKAGPDEYSDGSIDELYVYNRALTEGEIQAVFSSDGWTGNKVLQTPLLYSPVSGATNLWLNPKLLWGRTPDTASFTIQVSTDSLFSTTVFDKRGVADTTCAVASLNGNTTYFWRVRTENIFGKSEWSITGKFTTIVQDSLPTTGLVAYYPFNGNANDESNNGNNGTVTGATLAEDRFGNAGFAYSFNGIDNSIIVPSSTSLNIQRDITLSAWFKTDEPIIIADAHTGGLVAKHETHLTRQYDLFLNDITSDSLSFDVIDNRDDNTDTYLFNTAIPCGLYYDNQWHSVIGTYDYSSGYTFLYIDGLLAKTKYIGQINLQQSNTPLTIGCHGLPPSGYRSFYHGQIDDIRIYNRSLMSNEVQALFHEGGYEPPVAIISPVGGENWRSGEVDTIEWKTAAVTGLKLEYTTNDGSDWMTITEAIPSNMGKYLWTVPNTPSTQCKVKISKVIDPTIYAVSAASFTIRGATTALIDLPLVIKDNTGGMQVLRFGVDPSATDGLDKQFGEIEELPVSTTDLFDARFIDAAGTNQLGLGSRTDIRKGNAADLGSKTFKFTFQATKGASAVTISWNLPTGLTGYLIDYPAGGIVNREITGTDSLVMTNLSVTTMLIGVSGTQAVQNLTLENGWNLVSVPVAMEDMSASALFPNASSPLYCWNDEYAAVSALGIGGGYWVKYPDTATVTFTGSSVGLANIPVKAGWNMIGVHESSISAGLISTAPAGIITTKFFGYRDGYYWAEVLQPGLGYWVKAKENGFLQLPNGLIKAGNTALAEPPKDCGRIWFTDAAGKSMTLYAEPHIKNTITNKMQYDLPPVPPAGVFDVRFASQSMFELLGSATKEVFMQGVKYPIAITVDGLAIIVRDKATGGKIFNQSLQDKSTTVLGNAHIDRLEVLLVSAPLSYELSQNYPNPFNPTTTIKFGLPEKAVVTLTVYNQLGERIEILAQGQLDAGYHSIVWNAANVPSGIYFYELKAGKFKSAMKMIILK